MRSGKGGCRLLWKFARVGSKDLVGLDPVEALLPDPSAGPRFARLCKTLATHVCYSPCKSSSIDLVASALDSSSAETGLTHRHRLFVRQPLGRSASRTHGFHCVPEAGAGH
eukprot:363761-Chlamydomonas_euryale.AAC.20